MSGFLEGRVAIVTGAGAGLGRSHALAMAAAGAKVVVNDLSSTGYARPGEAVAAEINGQGGEAFYFGASVTDADAVDEMALTALKKWGRIDILVNNAGILRDKSFAKLTADDFRLVMEVHVMGAFNCSKAVWTAMRDQNYGRIIMTSSASGIYGNFGQANYAAAKMALVGLMNTLHIEGEKYNIRVNALAPTAYTQMLAGLVDESTAQMLTAESVSAGVVFLASEEAPSKTILGAGGGCFAVSHIYETPGVYLHADGRTPAEIARRFDEISTPITEGALENAFSQIKKFSQLAKNSA